MQANSQLKPYENVGERSSEKLSLLSVWEVVLAAMGQILILSELSKYK